MAYGLSQQVDLRQVIAEELWRSVGAVVRPPDLLGELSRQEEMLQDCELRKTQTAARRPSRTSCRACTGSRSAGTLVANRSDPPRFWEEATGRCWPGGLAR
jgi:hypothetical protein